MLLAPLVVHLPDDDMFVIINSAAVPNFTAWMGRSGKEGVFEQVHRRLREQRGIDPITDERGPQRDLPAAVACR